MSNTRCYYPTNSISIRSTGAITQCCSVGKPIDNISVFSESDEIINNPYIVSLRSDLNNGIKNDGCSECWKNEEAGAKSSRMDTADIPCDYEISSIETSVITYNDLHWLDIDIGNKCNLACRMCGPWASSLIAKQQYKLEKMNGKSMSSSWMIGQAIETSISNSVRDKIFEIISKSNNLKKIHIYGGEPLLIDFHDELCEYLIANNRAKDIRIVLSSNLQVDLQRKLELYKHFKIHMLISIDGIEDTYEYIRWPGKWEKLRRNLIEWQTVAKQRNEENHNSCYNTSVTLVLQNLNIDNICNFLIEMQKLDIDKISIERVWGTNLIEIAPTRIIEEEIEKLNNLLKINESDVKFVDLINNAKSLLESCVEPSKKLDRVKVIKFFDAQYQHDIFQNQNLFTAKPYFLELAKQFNINPW